MDIDRNSEWVRRVNGQIVVDVPPEIAAQCVTNDETRPIGEALKMLIEMKSRLFRSEMQIDETALSSMFIDYEAVARWGFTPDREFMEKTKLNPIYFGIDLGFSTTKKADKTAIAIAAVFDDTVWIFDVWSGKMEASEKLKQVQMLAVAHRPATVFCEAQGQQLDFVTNLRAASKLHVEPIYHAKGKEQRLNDIAPSLTDGSVRFAKNLAEVWQQLAEGMQGRHDDELDSCLIVAAGAIEAGTKTEEPFGYCVTPRAYDPDRQMQGSGLGIGGRYGC